MNWGDFANHPAATLCGLTNLLPDAALTVTGAGDADLALDERLHTFYVGASGDEITADFGSPVAISAFGVVDPQGTLSLHYSDDDAVYTPVLTGLTADRVLFETFSEATHRYWRIGFTGTGAVGAAVLWLGQVHYGAPQTQGFTPPEFADLNDLQVNLSNNGTPLGNRVERGNAEFDLTAANLHQAHVVAALQPIRDHVKVGRGFFLKWSQGKPAAYCWARQQVGGISQQNALFHSGTLPLVALVEGVTP